MHITAAEHGIFVVTAIIIVLITECFAVLLSVRTRSWFGFFASLTAFSGTIGGVLLINASRDWSGHFKYYKSIDGIDTWRTTQNLFWANIDPVFIEAPVFVAVVSAIIASILYSFQGRRLDVKLERLEFLEAEFARLKRKPKDPKKTAGKPATDAQSEETSSEDSSEKVAPKRTRLPKQTPSPETSRNAARSLA